MGLQLQLEALIPCIPLRHLLILTSLPGTVDTHCYVVSYCALQVCHMTLTRSQLLFSWNVAASPRLPWFSSAGMPEVGFCWMTSRPIWEESPKGLTSSLAGNPLLSHPLGREDRKAHLLLPPGLSVSRSETAAQLPGILWPLYELSLREGIWRKEVGHTHIKYQR